MSRKESPIQTDTIMRLRARFAKSRDKYDRIDRMVIDLVMGVSNDQSAAVIEVADAEIWDRLEPEIRAMLAAGKTVCWTTTVSAN